MKHLPVSEGFAARALLDAVTAADGAGGIVDGDAGHLGRHRPISTTVEIGVDLKVLRGRVLDQVKQHKRYRKQSEYQMKEPVQIQAHSGDMHLRRFLCSSHR